MNEYVLGWQASVVKHSFVPQDLPDAGAGHFAQTVREIKIR